MLATASQSALECLECVVTSDADERWRRAVTRLDGARLAHAPEWLTVVERAYGHEPLYVTVGDGAATCGVLPAFVVRRPLVGSIVASMPFLDGGGPCAVSPTLANMLVDRLVAEARRRGARFVELRSAERLAIDATPLEHKVNMTLALPANAGELWRRLDKTVRNQVRKAERAGLSIEIGTAASLPAFYDIFVERMRDLGSPVHAIGFLRAVLDAFGERAQLVLVTKGGTPVGGLIALSFKDRVTVPWATCLKEYFALCPNMLLYWHTIEAACAGGFRSFDFGRSTRQSGTYRFKAQWGAREEPLYWYRIPVAHDAQPGPKGPGLPRPASEPGPEGPGLQRLATTLWQRLPLALTRRLGPRIRKYLIQ